MVLDLYDKALTHIPLILMLLMFGTSMYLCVEAPSRSSLDGVLGICFLFLFCFLAQIPDEDGVLVLSPENFADAVAEVRRLRQKFYSFLCYHNIPLKAIFRFGPNRQ